MARSTTMRPRFPLPLQAMPPWVQTVRFHYPILLFLSLNLIMIGPWWYIPTSVDFPDQYMYLFPSLSNTTLIVNASACSSQSSSCPLPLPALWYQSGADIVSNDTETYSPLHSATEWDSRYAALLNISGQGRYFSERLTLYANGDYSYVDAGGDILGTVMEISNGYEVMFPGGAGYTIDGGFVSFCLRRRVGSEK